MANMARVLEGKLAIVTGGSRGLGAAIARVLASKGADVVLGYTSPSSTELSAKLASELQEKFNVRILAVQANLSDSTGPSKLVEESKKQFTKPKDDSFTIDIIINNAGVLKMGAVGSIDLEKDLIPSYQVNVFAPLLLVQAALPYLPNDRSGRIINVSSTSSSNGCADQSVYGGTKAALEAMTRTWSRELSERATVVAINPGPVMTDMFQTTSDEFPQGLQPMVELAPLAKIRKDVDGEQVQKDWGPMRGRPAYPEEISSLVGMLCGPESSWCTGSVVCANGGMQFTS